MKKYITFIQSVTEKEWELGKMLCEDINYNPDNSECDSDVFNVKTFQELKDILLIISDTKQDAYIIIVIYAHANPESLVFKDINKPDENYNDCVQWSMLDEILNYLYGVHEMKISIIFISCCSSVYAETVDSPHIPIIAAEGKISSRRAGEQLYEFFKKICTGYSVKEAYEFMIESFPIEEELNRNEKDKSILKLYI